MPRSTSHSKSSSVPVFRNPSSTTVNTQPVHVDQPTLGQTLKLGFGFGAGSAIAHRIFGATPTIMMPTSSDQKIESPCEKERLVFETCMKTKTSDDFCGYEQAGYSNCLQLRRK